MNLVGRIVETEAAWLNASNSARFEHVSTFFNTPAPMVVLHRYGLKREYQIHDANGPFDFVVDAYNYAADVVSSGIDAISDGYNKIASAVSDVGDFFKKIYGAVTDKFQCYIDSCIAWGQEKLDQIKDIVSSVADRVKEFGGSIDEFLQSIPVVGEIYTFVTSAISAAQDLTLQIFTILPRLFCAVVSGKNLGDFFSEEASRAGATAGAIAEFAACITSFIPGIGTLTGPMLSLVGGLLQGKNISEALVSATCKLLPGGALIQAGAQLGSRVAIAIASGERLDRAAIAALKNSLPKNCRAAFVVALELAQGNTLENAVGIASKEGLPIEELSNAVGFDPKAIGLGSFSGVLKYGNLPPSIVKGIDELRKAGGSLIDGINFDEPQLPNLAQVKALAEKIGVSVDEAEIAIGSFNGSLVVTYNTHAIPAVLAAKLGDLEQAMAQSASSLDACQRAALAYLRASNLNEGVGVQAITVLGVGVGTEFFSGKRGKNLEPAIAALWAEGCASDDQRSRKGGARRVVTGAAITIIGLSAPKPNGRMARLRATMQPRISQNLATRFSTIGGTIGPHVDSKLKSFAQALEIPTIALTQRLGQQIAAQSRKFNLVQNITVKGIDDMRYYENSVQESSGLDPSNRAVYIVESGDGPIKIAKKIVGDGNRWRELVTANPKKPIKVDGADKGNFVTLGIGERLNVPISWETAIEKGTTPGGATVQPVIINAVPVITPGKDNAPTRIFPSGGPAPTLVVPGLPQGVVSISPVGGQLVNRPAFVPAGPQLVPAPANVPVYNDPNANFDDDTILGMPRATAYLVGGAAVAGGLWLAFGKKRR